jgi:RNA polymerase sigma factor (sigma-70 family)
VRPDLTVYLVEDDASVRESLVLLLGMTGYRTRAFSDAESFLSAWQPSWIGCVVADLRLPGMSGVALQARVQEQGGTLPFIIVTAHGDVSSARAAFRAHAVDFLEKPFDHAQLKNAIQKAFDLEGGRIEREAARQQESEKLRKLTSREREVLDLAARGLHAKEIAAKLGISPRTVEVHKTRIMEKLEVRNVAELVRFALAAGD